MTKILEDIGKDRGFGVGKFEASVSLCPPVGEGCGENLGPARDAKSECELLVVYRQDNASG